MTEIKFYTHENGEKTAYKSTDGEGVGVFYLAGHKSHMGKDRAKEYEKIFSSKNIPFTAFDYHGFGQSSGEPEVQGLIRYWTNQALDILDNCTTGKQIIVGVSMGGWLMCALALLRPERVAGLVGVCPGFGMSLGPKSFEHYGVTRVCDIDNVAGFNFGVNEEDRHTYVSEYVNVHCPVRLYHSYMDERVKWPAAHSLLQNLPEDADAQLMYTRGGGHDMKRDIDYQNTLALIQELRGLHAKN